MCVGSAAPQADRHPGSRCLVAVETRGVAQVASHHVQISIVVQISQCHGCCYSAILESPFPTPVFKTQVSSVAEGEVGRVESRESREVSQALLGARSTPLERLGGQDVGMLHVVRVAVGHQQVFPTVEIHVDEDGAPGPFGSSDSGELSDLSKGAARSGYVQGVSGHLGAVLRIVDRGAQYRVHGVGTLPSTAFWIAAQHVHHEEVHQSVSVDVSDIHGHGAEALVS